MKAALIPPVAHLQEFCWDSRFHLVLSHLLDNPAYLGFYREQRLMGSYLVMDNGAHENTAGEDMEHLLKKALKIRADEIVLPDTLFDHRATVRGAEDALIYLLGPGQDVWGNAFPRLMVVPQGRTRDEWDRCFQDLVAAYVRAQQARPDLFARNLVVGVSKDYDQWADGHLAVLEHLEGFREWISFDVHLLGWARDLSVLGELAHRFPWIRSTDSAKPFVYALNGIRLVEGMLLPEYPRRTPDYFDMVLGVGPARIAATNVAFFRKFAHDTR